MDHDSPPQGAEISASGVHYRLWAPKAREVSVEVESAPGEGKRAVPLTPGGNGFYHGLDTLGRVADRYKIRLDGAAGLPDPASRWQPEGVHGPSMVIDPRSYQWRDDGWRRPPFRDLVIYEAHIGTFSPEGTFRGAIGKLGHIRDCGANAIEILPVADFAGERNWGYDGVSWFAPAHSYGHPDDLRALVDAAHRAGLAVILDVVYNHFGPAGNYLHAYVGDYLDEAEKTPWGGAIRYGHPDFKPLRELVVSNPAYWMSEFHIDGFRLDATHAIVDASPRHMLQELTESIHRAGGYAIAEDPRNDVRLVVSVEEGGFGFDAVWADDFHHIVRVSNTAEAESYLADFTGSLQEAVDALRNGWFYRGQFSKFAAAPRGTECAEVSPEAFVHCTSNHDQTGNHAFGERLCHRIPAPAQRAADALLCLTPYTPMLFMGQEWGASTPFLFFTDHNAELGRLIIEGRREEFKHFAAFSDEEVRKKIPNPQALSSFEASKLLWDERERGPHACTLALFRAFLGLRTREAAFRPTSRDTWRVEELTMGVGALIHSSAQTEWVVLFDLRGGHRGDLRQERIFQTSGVTWTAEISTNEERFGGSRPCAVNLGTMSADFTDAETVVLRGIRG